MFPVIPSQNCCERRRDIKSQFRPRFASATANCLPPCKPRSRRWRTRRGRERSVPSSHWSYGGRLPHRGEALVPAHPRDPGRPLPRPLRRLPHRDPPAVPRFLPRRRSARWEAGGSLLHEREGRREDAARTIAAPRTGGLSDLQDEKKKFGFPFLVVGFFDLDDLCLPLSIPILTDFYANGLWFLHLEIMNFREHEMNRERDGILKGSLTQSHWIFLWHFFLSMSHVDAKEKFIGEYFLLFVRFKCHIICWDQSFFFSSYFGAFD